MAMDLIALRTNMINKGGAVGNPLILDYPFVDIDYNPIVNALMLGAKGISPESVGIGVAGAATPHFAADGAGVKLERQDSGGLLTLGVLTASGATHAVPKAQLDAGLAAANAYADAAAAAVEAGDVDSFNGRIGTVVPASGDYTAGLIAFTPAGTIAAVDVQAALVELDGDIDGLTAADIAFTPAGGIAATDVQAAIVEALTDANAYSDAIIAGSIVPWIELRPALTGVPQIGHAEIDGTLTSITVGSVMTLHSSQLLIQDQMAAIESALVSTGLITTNTPAGAGATYGASGSNMTFGANASDLTSQSLQFVNDANTVALALGSTPISIVGATGNRFVANVGGAAPSIVLDDFIAPATGNATLTSATLTLFRQAISTRTVTVDAVTGAIKSETTAGASFAAQIIAGTAALCGLSVGGIRVVGQQGAAIADATDAASAITQLNLVIAQMRLDGKIAT